MTTVDFIGEISASLQEGGWKASGDIFNDADRLAWYQELEIWYYLYRGGAWEGTPRLGFRGHSIPKDWQKSFQNSVAGWQGATAQEFLKRLELQGIFFAENASPANEHQLAIGSTYGDIVNHILGQSGQYGHWDGVIDIWPEGFCRTNIDTTNSAPFGTHEVKAGGTIWGRLQEIAQAENFLLWVSKDNVINYQLNGMFAATLPGVTMDFTSAHFLVPLKITNRNTEEIGQIKLFGTTPGGEQISGTYPTEPTAGVPVIEQGYMAKDNTQMTAVATRKYKYANRSHTVIATMPGAIGLLFEIMDRVSITYTSAADGVTWSAKKFWIEEITVRISDAFNATTQMRLEAENA